MKQKPKILIIDDNPANIDFLIELLNDYDVQAVLSAEEADEAMQNEKPDVILLDITMPGIDGLEYCRRLKAFPDTKNIPVIFVTASDDEETIRTAFKSGGSDYITKPYKNDIVKIRIATQIRMKQLQAWIKRAQVRDEETGLRKRSVFMQEAKQWLEFAKKSSDSVSVVALHIDNLEEINRRCGYDETDKIVEFIGHRIDAVPEKNKIATRRAGALFLIVFYGLDEIAAKRHADWLRAAIARPNIQSCPNLEIVSSYGIADNLLTDNLDKIITAALAKKAQR